jgi:hypothetical protein
MYLALCVDPDLVPGVQVLTDGIAASADELVA